VMEAPVCMSVYGAFAPPRRTKFNQAEKRWHVMN
jgi:hypothetical protein